VERPDRAHQHVVGADLLHERRAVGDVGVGRVQPAEALGERGELRVVASHEDGTEAARDHRRGTRPPVYPDAPKSTILRTPAG
jgi:hypothetical protein